MLRLAPCRQLSLTILLGDCVSRAAPFLWAVFFFFFFFFLAQTWLLWGAWTLFSGRNKRQ